VPQVAGIQEQLAVTKIKDAGLVPSVTRQPSTDTPKGTVVSQNPDAGTKVQKHQTVELVVSTGPPTVPVPSVIGQNRDAAISALVNAGLSPKAYPVPSSKPVDTVTGQDPPAGKVVEKGSSVRINYSSGPAEVDVPNVVGLPYDQAASSLQGQGFGVKRTDVDSDQPKDTVVSQSPNRAPAGATITLSVSKGPKMSTVPDVTSQDQGSAKSTLQAAGFTVQVQQQDVQDPGLVGIVLSQSPTGNTKAKQGSTVTITVGRQAAQNPQPPPPALP
jgi:serine/threonine-protein kinase